MGDDGMLLNFSTTEPTPVYQPKFKGGTWKERLVAQRVSRHRQQRRVQRDGPEVANSTTDPVDHPQSQSGFSQLRPTKRRKEIGEFRPASGPRPTTTPVQTSRDHSTSHAQHQPREVISSLFSYNPTPQTAPDQPSAPANDVPAQPSNAPLVDGADTFSSLGLSNAIANHLITKLGLRAPTAIQRSSITQLVQEDSDAFIQAETGSGKTLAYLLPLIQKMASLSIDPVNGSNEGSHEKGLVHRDSGVFAIIIAPTRELCKQISVVLERLLGCAHWLVPGIVIGGEKKKSEKARLRKGLNVLVATPGRLADHLENTKVLNVSNVRWLVLDEGDRLMDLGFEDDIQKIVKKLDEAHTESDIVGLPLKRMTVLCSATMKMNVQRLGEISLKDAALIKANETDTSDQKSSGPDTKSSTTFYAPAQLKQSYTVVASKLRLVALSALIKRTFARKGSVMKAIVFISCADSVDFHYDVFTRPMSPEVGDTNTSATSTNDIEPANKDKAPFGACPTLFPSSSNGNTIPPNIYKLHGSLPQPTRTAILRHFSASIEPCLLLATDVASRGLDLPNLDLVIEYDPAFSSDDHLHRIGRTARLGRDGRAIIFLQPGSEEGYVDVLRSAFQSPGASDGLCGHQVTHTACNDILKRGFEPNSGVLSKSDPAAHWETQATSYQLAVERWVLSSARHQEIAKRAFQSHLRAYATHIATERKWFDIKALHLGHMAKAFGLRNKPGSMSVQGIRSSGGEKRKLVGPGRSSLGDENAREGNGPPMEGVNHTQQDEAARKMKKKMREMGNLGGAAAEFNIA